MGLVNIVVKENIIKIVKLKNIQKNTLIINIKIQIIKKYFNLVFLFLLKDKSITKYVDNIVNIH
jgi:hypothetical protein